MTDTTENLAEEIPEIRLHIENQIFAVKKDVLCEHSDYFRAMFSGNYVENNQHDITIDVDAVDANSMKIILHYFQMGFLELSLYELPVVGCLATASNFLQITELTKQIEYCLDIQLTHLNWVETMTIAQNAAYKKLEQSAAAYGLLNFKTMKVNFIPSVEKLFWYLSHPYLDTNSELDVFKFGLQWILCTETGADALLIILGCLDMNRLHTKDLKEIRADLLKNNFVNSLAEKVVECLLNVCESESLTEAYVISQKQKLCELFTERVYGEVLNLVKESKERKLLYTPAVPVWQLKDSKLDFAPHFMYTFSKEKGFEKWLEVADKNLWGWSIVSWGAYKLVVVGGEHGRGAGAFMRDVKEYDTLKKEWICHGIQLPQRRHGGATILGDTLYFVGGVGGFRVTLDTGITYDMKQRSYRNITNLLAPIQSPAICSHKGKIYGAVDYKHIYRYDDDNEPENNGTWKLIVNTEVRYNKMISFKDHIYCSQNYFSSMFRFNPGVKDELELITTFGHPAAAICSLKNHLIVFTRPMCTNHEFVSVEEFNDDNAESRYAILMNYCAPFTINDVAGSCTAVLEFPPVQNSVSPYHQKYISQYSLHVR